MKMSRTTSLYAWEDKGCETLAQMDVYRTIMELKCFDTEENGLIERTNDVHG